MKNVLIISLVFTVAILGGLVAINESSDSPHSSATKVATQTTTPKTYAAIRSAISAGGTLIDVRTAEEYAVGHIKEAAHLSLQDIEAGNLPKVEKTQPVYLYCRSGNRSAQAAAILRKVGYTNIIDLGAIQYVQSLGGSLVTES